MVRFILLVLTVMLTATGIGFIVFGIVPIMLSGDGPPKGVLRFVGSVALGIVLVILARIGYKISQGERLKRRFHKDSD